MIRTINNFLRHIKHLDIYIATPILDMLLFCMYADFQLDTVLFTVIFFLFLVDAIVIYSMMITDVEERTYEFAMLRTLGFQKSSLMILLVLQALFFSIPATAIGFMINYLFTVLAQILLHQYLGISLQVSMAKSTIILGLFTGICIPLVSNIYPIKQALNSTLRDALDRSRKGVDDTEVQILRLENAGCSPV